MEKHLTIALLVAVCFTSGYALNCITCNSAINSECGDPFTANQEKYLAKCEPEETYCGKTVSTENVRTPPLIIRKCVADRSNKNFTWNPVATCQELNQLTVCYCKSSRCNGSDKSSLCIALLAISVLFAYIFRKSY